jgi:hypothetical protein
VSLLLHAISPKPEQDSTPGAGLRGLPLVRVDADGLSAWVTSLPVDEAPFSREDVLAGHDVVNAVFEWTKSCLPARFPTVVADEETLRGRLSERREELRQRLELVSGACELAVTAAWLTDEKSSPDIRADTPGRRYMLQRQAMLAGSERRRARACELADALGQLLGSELRQAQRRVCPSAEVALSLALLVDRVGAEDVRERLSLYSTQDVRILVNGPWPPYSFAT